MPATKPATKIDYEAMNSRTGGSKSDAFATRISSTRHEHLLHQTDAVIDENGEGTPTLIITAPLLTEKQVLLLGGGRSVISCTEIIDDRPIGEDEYGKRRYGAYPLSISQGSVEIPLGDTGFTVRGTLAVKMTSQIDVAEIVDADGNPASLNDLPDGAVNTNVIMARQRRSNGNGS